MLRNGAIGRLRAGNSRRSVFDFVPVPIGPDAVDPAVHRSRDPGVAGEGSGAPGGVLPLIRGRLPRNARRDRESGEGALPWRGGEGVAPDPQPERPPRMGEGGCRHRP